MKIKNKENGFEMHAWHIETPEIKTFNDCVGTIARLGGAGEDVLIECTGYEDMDEHGNRVSFKSVTFTEIPNGVVAKCKMIQSMVSLLFASGLSLSRDVFLLSPIIHLLCKNYPLRVQ